MVFQKMFMIFSKIGSWISKIVLWFSKNVNDFHKTVHKFNFLFMIFWNWFMNFKKKHKFQKLLIFEKLFMNFENCFMIFEKLFIYINFFSWFVGTPDYPSGIPDMHTIHDPMISVSWIHISELITLLYHPLQYRIIYLQLVTWPIMILPRRASL
jgi:hypothetical protein